MWLWPIANEVLMKAALTHATRSDDSTLHVISLIPMTICSSTFLPRAIHLIFKQPFNIHLRLLLLLQQHHLNQKHTSLAVERTGWFLENVISPQIPQPVLIMHISLIGVLACIPHPIDIRLITTGYLIVILHLAAYHLLVNPAIGYHFHQIGDLHMLKMAQFTITTVSLVSHNGIYPKRKRARLKVWIRFKLTTWWKKQWSTRNRHRWIKRASRAARAAVVSLARAYPASAKRKVVHLYRINSSKWRSATLSESVWAERNRCGMMIRSYSRNWLAM